MRSLCQIPGFPGSFPGCIYQSARARLAAARLVPTSRRWQTSGSASDLEKPYYCTTPIFYVNAAPHVGHLYSLVLADIFKRWHALKGRRALMCTGTDEHGMKVQRAADQAKTEASAFCDAGAEVFESLAEAANISNDDFIRTTESRHKDAVQHAWTVLKERDLIYLSKHEGWYCVSDETFYPESGVQLAIDPPTGRKMMVSQVAYLDIVIKYLQPSEASIETGKEVEWSSETNYRFRLSAFREPLLKLYQTQPDFIVPKQRRKDVLKAVSEDLQDLSVSRPTSRLSWGIPVPGDESQTIYVWLDALLNYATSAGFPWTPGKEAAQAWPADLHVIGKDIVRFHCIYWPAFLMGLGAPLPKQVLVHAHWTLGKTKMAKSTGNVVNPFFAMDRFGVDAIRYYLAHDGGISHDSDYGNEMIAEKYNKGLKGGVGNLLSRVMRGKKFWSVERAVARARDGLLDLGRSEQYLEHRTRLEKLAQCVDEKFDRLDCGGALRTVMDAVYTANAFLQNQEPWNIAKTKERDQDAETKVDEVIYLTAETVRICGILLQPFIPGKADELLAQLGVTRHSRTFAHAKYGADLSFGRDDAREGVKGVLFPPLMVED